MANTIDRDDLLRRLLRGDSVTVVEALPPKYFKKQHIPGAVNLPHDQVDERAPELLPDKDTTIVVYCANDPCPNSGIAAQRLNELGYSDVFDYEGGKEDWIEAGLPVEKAA